MGVFMSILGSLSAFNQGVLVTLYELDLTRFGGEVLRFHAGVNDKQEPVTWQGNVYQPYPVEASGFSRSSSGAPPRPKLKVSNYQSAITTVLMMTGGIEGARFKRKRTKLAFLDAVNFVGGNPIADPMAHLPDDVFYVVQKTLETPELVEFELGAVTDLDGVMLPRRQINANYCPFKYRGQECGFVEPRYYTLSNDATMDQSQDVCSKTIDACKLRFGANGELSFGGFPAAGLVRFT